MKFDILKELFLTLSKKASLLCSKKIERLVSFSLAIMMIIVYFVVKLFCLFHCEFTTTDVILLSGTLLSYGAYNTVRISKDLDRKKDDETPSTTV